MYSEANKEKKFTEQIEKWIMYFLYVLFGGLFFLISLQGSWSEAVILLPVAAFTIPLTKWGMRWQNERYIRSAQNQDDLKIVMAKLEEIEVRILKLEGKMISLELMANHMAWANQEIYKEVQKLDDKVLDYYVVDPDWTVKTIMIHIAGAAHLYGQRLNGDPFSRFELKNTEGSEMIDELLTELNRIDKSLIENVDREDGEFTYTTSKGEQTAKVSEVLSQMIFHAGEHRAQIVAALDKHNERSINLDNYSVWGYTKSLS